MIREGDVGDCMLLVLSGTVHVTKKSKHVETSRLPVIKQGAALGEMSMLDAAPRYATCTAIEEVQADVLTRQTIGHLIHEHPAVGAKLLVKLTQLLRNTSNQLVRLIQKKHSDWCLFNSGQRLYFTSHRFQSSAVMHKMSRTKGSDAK